MSKVWGSKAVSSLKIAINKQDTSKIPRLTHTVHRPSSIDMYLLLLKYFLCFRPNLMKSLEELGLVSGSELVVADPTTPNSVVFRLILKD